MNLYREKYPVGADVKVASADRLRAFMRPAWEYHNPLAEAQLASAGKRDKVRSVNFYHGGDVLYELASESGTWHESCLEPNENSP